MLGWTTSNGVSRMWGDPHIWFSGGIRLAQKNFVPIISKPNYARSGAQNPALVGFLQGDTEGLPPFVCSDHEFKQIKHFWKYPALLVLQICHHVEKGISGPESRSQCHIL
uniref:Uncharacterized protein n=1 Tax=Arundo donax TaxID=35708 RepID=A0A0A8XXM6_ARUDO